MPEIQIVPRCPHRIHHVTWLVDGQPGRLSLTSFFSRTLELIQELLKRGESAEQLRVALQDHFERFDAHEYRYIALVEAGPRGPIVLAVVLESLDSGDPEVTTYAAVAGFIGYEGHAFGTSAEGQPYNPPPAQHIYDAVTQWALVTQPGLSQRSESWLANRGRLGRINRVANASSYLEAVVLALRANITHLDAVVLPLPAMAQPDAFQAAIAYLMLAGFHAYHLIPSGLEQWYGRSSTGTPQNEQTPDLLFLSSPVERTPSAGRVIEDTPPI